MSFLGIFCIIAVTGFVSLTIERVPRVFSGDDNGSLSTVLAVMDIFIIPAMFVSMSVYSQTDICDISANTGVFPHSE